MACSVVGAKICKDVGRALLGRRLALPGSMGLCGFAHNIQLLDCPGEVWATQRAFLLPYQEGARGSHEVPFKPVVPAESLKACALMEDWELGRVALSCHIAMDVIGQNWSGEKVSLCLEDWELARVAISCHIALDVTGHA